MGLRFGDAQRTAPCTIVLDEQVMRLTAWATKTSRRGQPAGCITSGLAGRPPNWCWAHIFFNTLRSTINDMCKAAGTELCIDFLILDMITSESGDPEPFASPMPFWRAQGYLRHLLQSPKMGMAAHSPLQARSLSLHSCKRSLLAVARQLDVKEAHWEDQGHHKRNTGRTSLRVYSQDEIFGALALQREIRDATVGGWTPLIALGRGSQIPLKEIKLPLPPAPENWVATLIPDFDSSRIQAKGSPWDETIEHDQRSYPLTQALSQEISEDAAEESGSENDWPTSGEETLDLGDSLPLAMTAPTEPGNQRDQRNRGMKRHT